MDLQVFLDHLEPRVNEDFLVDQENLVLKELQVSWVSQV